MSRVTWRGVTVDARTRDQLDEVAALTPALPYLQPSQGSYTTAVGASAGTHAGGGAVDIRCSNLSRDHMTETVRVMRTVGFAAWLRLPSEGDWPIHIHGISIGCPDLSASARRQVEAYRDGRNGLANNGPDTGPDVPFTTWEDYLTMAITDADLDKIAALIRSIVRAIVRAELERPITRFAGSTDPDHPETSIRTSDGGRYGFLALREAGRIAAKVDAVADAVAQIDQVDETALAASIADYVNRADAATLAEMLDIVVAPPDDVQADSER